LNGPHKQGDCINDRYTIIQYIGEGGMQFVYSATDSVLQRVVAIKTPKNDSAGKRFKRSAIVAAKVNHPHIAKTLDYIEFEQRSYLVEELIEGDDLDKALLKKTRHVDAYLAAKIFHYLAKGIAAAHHAGVVHRDIKPTNVMVSGHFGLDAIKITDFGIAKMADEELIEAVEGGESSISASKTAVGALPYMAPEAIDTPREVGYPADIWSIGAMMYQLLTGDLPFGSGLRAVKNILEAVPPTFPAFLQANAQFAPLASEISQLILRCLTKDPATRPTADQLVAQCGLFSYPISKRVTGVVRDVRHNAWGFIACEGRDVFFNMSSVIGARPAIGNAVMFSVYGGGGAPRAHPVILMPDMSA
jgi:serine/threonine protein kinase